MILTIVTLLYFLPQTLSMPFAGVLSDRLNRKIIIAIADSLQAFATFGLILFFLFNIAEIWIIFLFISLRSIFQAFHLPTVNAIIPTMVPKEKLNGINSINFLFTGIIQILAPLVAAFLMIYLTIYQLLWIDVITFVIALALLLLIEIPSVNKISKNEKENSFIEEFKTGFKTLKLTPGLFILLILAMLVYFLLVPFDTLLPYYIRVFHEGQALHYALTLVSFQGGMIVGSLITSFKKEWERKMKTIFLCVIIAMIGYVILSLAPKGTFLIIVIGGIITGFNLPIIFALYQSYVQTTVPADKIGRVTSFDHMSSLLLTPIAIMISGPLANIIGVNILFLNCALLALLVTILIWSFTDIKKVDKYKKDALDTITKNISAPNL